MTMQMLSKIQAMHDDTILNFMVTGFAICFFVALYVLIVSFTWFPGTEERYEYQNYHPVRWRILVGSFVTGFFVFVTSCILMIMRLFMRKARP